MISIVIMASNATWDNLTNSDLPITVSNVWESSVSVAGIVIRTNQAIDLSTVMTREDINRNIWMIYSNIINGKLTYTNAGSVPVKNF